MFQYTWNLRKKHWVCFPRIFLVLSIGISINPLQDVSFKQATLVALADAPSTRWITFTQPGGLGAAGATEAVEDDKGAVIAEIRLSRRNWGWLSWLDNWFFKLRR